MASIQDSAHAVVFQLMPSIALPFSSSILLFHSQNHEPINVTYDQPLKEWTVWQHPTPQSSTSLSYTSPTSFREISHARRPPCVSHHRQSPLDSADSLPHQPAAPVTITTTITFITGMTPQSLTVPPDIQHDIHNIRSTAVHPPPHHHHKHKPSQLATATEITNVHHTHQTRESSCTNPTLHSLHSSATVVDHAPLSPAPPSTTQPAIVPATYLALWQFLQTRVSRRQTSSSRATVLMILPLFAHDGSLTEDVSHDSNRRCAH